MIDQQCVNLFSLRQTLIFFNRDLSKTLLQVNESKFSIIIASKDSKPEVKFQLHKKKLHFRQKTEMMTNFNFPHPNIRKVMGQNFIFRFFHHFWTNFCISITKKLCQNRYKAQTSNLDILNIGFGFVSPFVYTCFSKQILVITICS